MEPRRREACFFPLFQRVCVDINAVCFFLTARSGVAAAESLSDNASAFSSRAKQLHRRMWWRDMKVGQRNTLRGGQVRVQRCGECVDVSFPPQMKIIVALVVIALLLVIISEYRRSV